MLLEDINEVIKASPAIQIQSKITHLHRPPTSRRTRDCHESLSARRHGRRRDQGYSRR